MSKNDDDDDDDDDDEGDRASWRIFKCMSKCV